MWREASLSECYAALNKFSNGNAPGNDGITPQSYQRFWNSLGQQLIDSLNYSCKLGSY